MGGGKGRGDWILGLLARADGGAAGLDAGVGRRKAMRWGGGRRREGRGRSSEAERLGSIWGSVFAG